MDNSDGSPANSEGGISYPGKGERHDIFFEGQVEPPEIADFDRSIFTEDTEYAGPVEGRSKLKILAITLITVGVISSGVYLLFFRGGEQPQGGGDNNSAQSASSSSSEKQTAETIKTECYSFSLPPPHDPITESVVCGGAYLSGENREAGITVSPIFQPYLSKEDLLADWKNSNSGLSITSETSSKLGNYNTSVIKWQSAETGDALYQTVLVYLGFDPFNSAGVYSVAGTPVSGFEIKGRYDSANNSQQVFESILASWQWL